MVILVSYAMGPLRHLPSRQIQESIITCLHKGGSTQNRLASGVGETMCQAAAMLPAALSPARVTPCDGRRRFREVKGENMMDLKRSRCDGAVLPVASAIIIEAAAELSSIFWHGGWVYARSFYVARNQIDFGVF
jgi:hypothetical protein